MPGASGSAVKVDEGCGVAGPGGITGGASMVAGGARHVRLQRPRHAGMVRVCRRPVMRVCRFQERGRRVEGLHGSGTLRCSQAPLPAHGRTPVPLPLWVLAGHPTALPGHRRARGRHAAMPVPCRIGSLLHLPVGAHSDSAPHGGEPVAAQHLDTWWRRVRARRWK